jgi:uncharacterized protein (TIGR02680 family)
MTVTALPVQADPLDPTRATRWLPARAGILNVWRYHDETFHFTDGRVLLRGPNGSGKSKALELLLPYLLDANLRPNRLSTFGTNERTMHWNLMGDGATGATRVGYVWLEFTDGAGRWLTCGARLAATSHTSSVRADYFTTDRRIGVDLPLVNEARQPLTRRVLEERLGDRGVVYDTASDYRLAIRTLLFQGMTEQRYDALVTALLQLRTPKLSQRLDPALLSTLLSRALPPLGQEQIADLAEGFERLDAQRERLAGLERDVAATDTLARRQRTYARRVLRHWGDALTSATARMDEITRTARESAEEYRQVAERKGAAEQLVDQLERDGDQLAARIAGLTDSEAYKQGRELDRLRQEVAAADRRAGALRADADRLGVVATRIQQDRAAAESAAADREMARQAAAGEAGQAAGRVGLDAAYAELTSVLEADADRARPLLRAVLRSRQEQLAEVGAALDNVERAVERRTEAERGLDETRAALTTAIEVRDLAEARRAEVLAALAAAVGSWAVGCRELSFADPPALAELVEAQPELMAEIEAVAGAVLQEVTRLETIAGGRLQEAQREAGVAARELDRLRSERDLPPVPPPTRTSDRTRLAGAPLWRLVDFRPGPTEPAQALVEAALESSGMLDAWVSADGRLEGHDILADPDALPAVAGASLADVLVPEEHADVSAAAVRRLLSAVAFGPTLPGGPAAVGADGSWRLGSLTGSWTKQHADFVGSRARERTRQRRIAELARQLGEWEALVIAAEAELHLLTRRRAAVAADRAAFPDFAGLAVATADLTKAEAEVAAADGQVRRAVAALRDRERAASTALRELAGTAAGASAPTERPALAALIRATGTFGDLAESWLDAQHALTAARATLLALAERADQAAETAATRAAEATEATAQHEQLAATLDAVEGTVGVDYRQTLQRLAELRREREDVVRRARATSRDVSTLAERLGNLDTKRHADADARDQATRARDAAAARFRHLASGALGADSGMTRPGATDGVRATLDRARALAAAWPTVSFTPKNIGDALTGLTDAVHDCRSALTGRADLELETDEDVQVFTAVIDGMRVGAAELNAQLRAELDRGRSEITDQERELFDQTLTGDTRRHLADRIRQANELVDGMNARLERVRTASKVAVRLVWEVMAELRPGTKAARDLLLLDPVRLTEQDRDSLHRFFRDRIEQARAEQTAANWAEQLAQVLDYTAWHHFVVKLDRDDGRGWQKLTKSLHGALSGGEKAIALHLPLFAAIAAHYQAVPAAPRLILLDEVFVGVDTTNRGQVFALLTALDLDLVLTSDNEWCTYAELPGISIHQLITSEDDDAVTTARFTWNGHRLTATE